MPRTSLPSERAHMLTEIEIEKLADAISRRLHQALADTLYDDIKDLIAEQVSEIMKGALNRCGNLLSDIAKDL